MKVVKFLSNIIIKIMVAIMIVSLLIVVLSIFITPSIIGIEGVEINGVSLEDQGLADVSFYNIGKILIGVLSTMEEEEVSDDTYTAVIDKIPTVANSTEEKDESLTKLTEEPLIFEESVEITMNSSELSALMNMAIGTKSLLDLDSNSLYAGDFSSATLLATKQVVAMETKVNLSDSDTVDSDIYEDAIENMTADMLLELMQEYDCQFVSITPTQDGNSIYMTTVMMLTLPDEVVSEINALGVITIGENVYVTYDSEYILEDGALVSMGVDESTLLINKLSQTETATIATSLLSIATGESVDGTEILMNYNNTLCELLAKILNNLGEVNGVENGELIITTRTE
ncbi:MAG: hypothetical protein R3Y65_05535 [Bacillota bacterium]